MSDEDYQLTPRREKHHNKSRTYSNEENHSEKKSRTGIKYKHRPRDKSNEKHRSHEKSNEKHRSREKSIEKHRSGEKLNEKHRSRDKSNEKHRSRDKSIEKHRSGERLKEKQRSRDKSNDKNRPRDKYNERSRSNERKHQPSDRPYDQQYTHKSKHKTNIRKTSIERTPEKDDESRNSPRSSPERSKSHRLRVHTSRKDRLKHVREQEGDIIEKHKTKKNESIHMEKDSSLEKESISHNSDHRDSKKKSHRDHSHKVQEFKIISNRERGKKEKRHKDKREKKVKKSEGRLYHSDSELESRNKTNRRARLKTTTDVSEKSAFEASDIDKPIDIDALYNLFYRDTDIHNESGEIKEAMLKKMFQKQANENSDKNIVKAAQPVLLDQSNIRSKLIKVLFQRVKDLLKETEELRNERKVSCSKIEMLTDEVKSLKERDKQQLEKENQIKERLEILADEMKITAQGTSFREEIQNILQNIQSKYQTHWKDHETKIHKVQTDAEIEIQTLMKNIVGKYVQLTELKDRSKVATDIANKQKMSEPLYIEIENDRDTEVENYYYRMKNEKFNSRNELLLKVAEPSKTFPTTYENEKNFCAKDMQLMYKNYETYNTEPDGKDSTTPPASVSDNDKNTMDFKRRNKLASTLGVKTTRPEQPLCMPPQTSIMPEQKSTMSVQKPDMDNLQYMSYNRTVRAMDTDPKLSTTSNPSTLSSKEFWRHRLLQPKPLETIRNEQPKQKFDSLRNQY